MLIHAEEIDVPNKNNALFLSFVLIRFDDSIKLQKKDAFQLASNTSIWNRDLPDSYSAFLYCLWVFEWFSSHC